MVEDSNPGPFVQEELFGFLWGVKMDGFFCFYDWITLQYLFLDMFGLVIDQVMFSGLLFAACERYWFLFVVVIFTFVANANCLVCFFATKNHQNNTFMGTNISHLCKSKIIFAATFEGELLVPWRAKPVIPWQFMMNQCEQGYSNFQVQRPMHHHHSSISKFPIPSMGRRVYYIFTYLNSWSFGYSYLCKYTNSHGWYGWWFRNPTPVDMDFWTINGFPSPDSTCVLTNHQHEDQSGFGGREKSSSEEESHKEDEHLQGTTDFSSPFSPKMLL